MIRTGTLVQPNQEGDLLSRGPALFVGYLKNLEGTIAEYQDGWFFTGDRAVMDEDGYIRISGRNKDIIIRGGENIPVAYVENVLYEHEDIWMRNLSHCLIQDLQEKACAVISMKPGRTPLTFHYCKNFFSKKESLSNIGQSIWRLLRIFREQRVGKSKSFA